LSNYIMGNKLKETKGQVAVITAILIVVLVGMAAYAIDVGSLYQEKRHLQTVADAAALAGAQELPERTDLAVQVAIDYAASHGVEITADDISITDTYTSNDTIIVTPVNPDKDTYFAGVLGFSSVEVAAQATALVGQPVGLSDLVPWGARIEEGMDWKDWLQGGEEMILKFGSKDPNEGNFYALDLDGHHGGGSSEYTDRIVNGYQGYLEVGDIILTETGNMATTVSATNERVGDTWYSFEDLVTYEGGVVKLARNTGQFVMIPVIYELENPSGQEYVEILGFAPFILTEISGKSGQAEIVGKLLDQALIVTEGSVTAVEEKGFRVIRLTK